ncbi:translation initiation factor IF-2-like isoform X10 [Thrips palmi]|uniref:Translation initiation factor IF-2-like isoform X10 n=1 Tax=Thrips palmi TaxID=161013 RepID=A0A6P9ADW4_THRPL|nr:translation initiation factor IF-2-like isoform X10 [Thrips palmi]
MIMAYRTQTNGIPLVRRHAVPGRTAAVAAAGRALAVGRRLPVLRRRPRQPERDGGARVPGGAALHRRFRPRRPPPPWARPWPRRATGHAAQPAVPGAATKLGGAVRQPGLPVRAPRGAHGGRLHAGPGARAGQGGRGEGRRPDARPGAARHAHVLGRVPPPQGRRQLAADFERRRLRRVGGQLPGQRGVAPRARDTVSRLVPVLELQLARDGAPRPARPGGLRAGALGPGRPALHRALDGQHGHDGAAVLQARVQPQDPPGDVPRPGGVRVPAALAPLHAARLGGRENKGLSRVPPDLERPAPQRGDPPAGRHTVPVPRRGQAGVQPAALRDRRPLPGARLAELRIFDRGVSSRGNDHQDYGALLRSRTYRQVPTAWLRHGRPESRGGVQHRSHHGACRPLLLRERLLRLSTGCRAVGKRFAQCVSQVPGSGFHLQPLRLHFGRRRETAAVQGSSWGDAPEGSRPQ